MNRADIAAWLTDLSPDVPCGEDEEYSADFRSLEEALAGKPDAQYGGTVIAATPPDWTLAHSLSMTLLERTRDLRVAVHYTRSGTVYHGDGSQTQQSAQSGPLRPALKYDADGHPTRALEPAPAHAAFTEQATVAQRILTRGSGASMSMHAAAVTSRGGFGRGGGGGGFGGGGGHSFGGGGWSSGG